MNRTVLPCGCQFWVEDIDGLATMTFEPHSVDCQWYVYYVADLR